MSYILIRESTEIGKKLALDLQWNVKGRMQTADDYWQHLIRMH